MPVESESPTCIVEKNTNVSGLYIGVFVSNSQRSFGIIHNNKESYA